MSLRLTAVTGGHEGGSGSDRWKGVSSRPVLTVSSSAVRVAIAHDYLTQRGGAERVVLEMLTAFPGAPLYTSLYQPEATFPEFGLADVRPTVLNRIPAFRADHRRALPLYPLAFRMRPIEADVTLCSSSGWAHGVRTTGCKVVYCYTPARWLYQPEEYLREASAPVRAALAALSGGLRAWDRWAASTADQYLTSSNAVRERIKVTYGRDAEVLPPPPALTVMGEQRPVHGLDRGFVLCVSRLQAYKNVDAVVVAAAELDVPVVIVGRGPDEQRLRGLAGGSVHFRTSADDAELRWLYANCIGLVAASYEDYGLTPLEAASFGKPVAVLRWGGFLDTVEEGVTGVFFDRPAPAPVARGLTELLGRSWDGSAITTHAERFSATRFRHRLREVVEDVDR